MATVTRFSRWMPISKRQAALHLSDPSSHAFFHFISLFSWTNDQSGQFRSSTDTTGGEDNISPRRSGSCSALSAVALSHRILNFRFHLPPDARRWNPRREVFRSHKQTIDGTARNKKYFLLNFPSRSAIIEIFLTRLFSDKNLSTHPILTPMGKSASLSPCEKKLRRK
jgi:hypothetical protein